MDNPELSTFEQLVGDPVTLGCEGHNLSAKIDSVEAATRHPGHTRQPFSIVFVSDESEVLPQQIFRVQHSSAGEFDLFLVPIGPRGGGMAYEAVFA